MLNSKIRNIFREWRAKGYEYDQLIRVVIDRDNLNHNIDLFQKNVGQKMGVVPVLKSNAYGHGLIEVAKILEKKEPEFLIVDSYFEALILRNEGIETPILIIGFSLLENVLKNQLKDVSFVITDLSWLVDLSKKLIVETKFHLKVNTGMNRQGVEIENIDQAIGLIQLNPNIRLEGICSHLADGDSENEVFTNKQIKKWNNVVRLIKDEFPNLKYWHLGASSSLYFVKKIEANMMRLGLGLYGFEADPKVNLNLKPVMDVWTIMTSIREVKKGEKIGYNGIFEAEKEMKIATIPMGYFEGVDRRLSNKGWVKIKNVFCPIVGRVSMNITSIDVSEIKNVKVGDEVNVISSVIGDKNSMENIAKICQTIPYEIMVDIERMLRREVKN